MGAPDDHPCPQVPSGRASDLCPEVVAAMVSSPEQSSREASFLAAQSPGLILWPPWRVPQEILIHSFSAPVDRVGFFVCNFKS